MIAEKIPALRTLSNEEKLILVGELWDELAAQSDTFPVRANHVKLLQERVEHYRKHPQDTAAWEDVRKRIRH